MTVADDIRDGLWWAIQRKDPEEMLRIAMNFYERFDCPKWDIVGIRRIYKGEYELDIEQRGPCGSDEIKTHRVTYSHERNRWGQYSDASFAKTLGQPVSYLNGVVEGISLVLMMLDGAEEKIEELRRTENSVRNEKWKNEKVLEAIDREAAESRAVKNAERAAQERADKEIAKAKQLYQAGQMSHYYPVPEPTLTVTKNDVLPLPEVSGIYFVWDGPVEYVGQSINIKNRVGLNHQNIREGDMVSWVEVPEHELDFAEAYYIGTLRPKRNFGLNAKWRRVADQ